MTHRTKDYEQALAAVERGLAGHLHAEIRNHERLRVCPHAHTTAMCAAIEAIIHAFRDCKLVFLIEAEISARGMRSRPEDIVVWIEHVGVLVLEIKSHQAAGIRRIENNIPVVMYAGEEHEDVLLIDQPRKFAYELRAEIEPEFDKAELPAPALYWAGWLPNVAPDELEQRGQRVNPDKVWLADMLKAGGGISQRLSSMNNLMRPNQGADRNGLSLFLKLFGCSAGLRGLRAPREPIALTPGSPGYQIDRLNNQLRRLTPEQEELAFSPNLLRGPKVIRGVAGSGKSVVLANAVANLLVETMRYNTDDLMGISEPRWVRVLVICYNRALAPYLRGLIHTCFDALKPESSWKFPERQVEVINFNRLFYRLNQEFSVGEYNPRYDLNPALLERFEQVALPDANQYTHILIDEGQDFDQEWFPFLAKLGVPDPEVGPPVVVFYDDAQNIYGKRRPGTDGETAWRDLLGADVSPRGLRTVMRVGHRNTNEILSFSFNMLLGACAQRDPQMAGFAGLSAYAQEAIPDDPLLNHPNAGRPCVERIGARSYRVNFALRSGPWPLLHTCPSPEAMLLGLVQTLRAQIDLAGDQVDPRDLLVMAPTHQTAQEAAGLLRREGFKVHLPLKDQEGNGADARDLPFFQRDTITVSTINSAKGHTAALCHLIALEQLECDTMYRESQETLRAKLHVAATRASWRLEVWGLECALMREAQAVIAMLKGGELAAG